MPRQLAQLLIGPSGSGKTTRARAALRRFDGFARGKRPKVVVARELMDELTLAIGAEQVERWHRGLREEIGFFLCEHLEDLSKRPAALQELGHACRTLIRAGATVLVTATVDEPSRLALCAAWAKSHGLRVTRT